MDETNTETGNDIEVINTAIRSILDGLKNNESKLSVSDLVRLLDARKQLASDSVREVKVTWVDTCMDQFAPN